MILLDRNQCTNRLCFWGWMDTNWHSHTPKSSGTPSWQCRVCCSSFVHLAIHYLCHKSLAYVWLLWARIFQTFLSTEEKNREPIWLISDSSLRALSICELEISNAALSEIRGWLCIHNAADITLNTQRVPWDWAEFTYAHLAEAFIQSIFELGPHEG